MVGRGIVRGQGAINDHDDYDEHMGMGKKKK